MCPNGETGIQLLRQTESTVVERILAAHPEMGEKRARAFYVKLWKLMCDARSARQTGGSRKPTSGPNLPRAAKDDSDDDGVSLKERAAAEAAAIRQRMEEKRREREAREINAAASQ